MSANNLTDTQLVLLCSASQHPEGAIERATDLKGTDQDGFEFPIFQGSVARDPDGYNRVKGVVQQAHEDTEIFPHFNNVNFHTGAFDPSTGD